MTILDQHLRRTKYRSTVIHFHTVDFLTAESPVEKNDRHSGSFCRIEEPSGQAYRKYQDSIHLAAQKELQIFFLHLLIVARIADQHRITAFMKFLAQIMQHIPYKKALYIIDQNSNSLGPVCDKPPRQLVHLVMQCIYRLFDQFPVPWKDVPAIKILGYRELSLP